MPDSRRSITLLALLTVTIVISQLFTALPARSAPTNSVHLQQVDKDKIDAYIQSRMQTASIPGLALGVVYDDQVVYLKGYGSAGPDGRSVTPQTPFILGSTSKSFTALAVMQLVEAGKIDLDAPVTKYLPWFRTSDAAASAKITIRNLLNQDSGLPTYEGRQGIAYDDQSSTALENRVRDLSTIRLNHSPGQAYEYSNENFNILGLIIQTVSGISYEEYIRSAIFNPLQMSHSAAGLTDEAAKDIATGYRYWLFWPLPFVAPHPRSMTPSGFLISSAEDMAHYLTAQLKGGTYDSKQILSGAGIDTLHRPGSTISPSSSYGMGWVIQGKPGSTEIWHNGDLSNFHSNLLLLLEEHIGIVTLVNIGSFLNSDALNIPIEGVASILLGKSLTASTNPPLAITTPILLLGMLLVSVLWIVWSYVSIRCQQQRSALPPHGISLLWRLFLPLAIELCPVLLTWILLPAQFRTPIPTIGLFAPDVFLIVVTITALSLVWATVRIFLTLQPRRWMPSANR